MITLQPIGHAQNIKSYLLLELHVLVHIYICPVNEITIDTVISV